MNIWASKHNVVHNIDTLTFENIRYGFIDKYLGPSKYQQVKPMIIFGITLRCIWNAHWKHIRDTPDREDFLDLHVANTIRAQLSNRIYEDMYMNIKIYHWLKKKAVEKKGSQFRFTLPAYVVDHEP